MKKFLFILILSLTLFSCSTNQHVIELETKGNGLYDIPIELAGDMTCKFILDTGCSETVVPDYIFYHLVKNNLVTKDDMLEPLFFTLADGSQVQCDRFILHKLKIGDVELTNISVSVSNSRSAFLLGQNVLSKFSRVEIDYSKNLIILKD